MLTCNCDEIWNLARSYNDFYRNVYQVQDFFEILINEEHATEHKKKRKREKRRFIRLNFIWYSRFFQVMANVVRKSHVEIIVNYMDE